MTEPPLFFDVMLHVGTLLAVVIYFRAELWKIMEGVKSIAKRGEKNQGLKLLLWIILGTIPTGLMGILFKDWFESFFSRPKLVGGMLILTGMILWLTRWAKEKGRTLGSMKWVDALFIGIAQGVSIIPGISRSGATISMGLFCGLDRELSGKFSFLLSIPAILGAILLEYKKIDTASPLGFTFLGTAVAFGVGFLSLTFLMKIVRVGKISHFSYYCCGMGALMIILS